MLSQAEKHRNPAQTCEIATRLQAEAADLRYPARFFHFLFRILKA